MKNPDPGERLGDCDWPVYLRSLGKVVMQHAHVARGCKDWRMGHDPNGGEGAWPGRGHGMAWDSEAGWGRSLTYSTLEHRRVRPPCWDCRVEARSTVEKGRAKQPPNFQSVGWMQPLAIATPEWTAQPGQPCTAEPLRRTGRWSP